MSWLSAQFSKIWSICEKVFIAIIFIAIIVLLSLICIDRIRVNQQLELLSTAIGEVRESTELIGAGLSEQGLIIDELADGQQSIETTVDDIRDAVESANRNLEQLVDVESDIDGDAGAIIATSRQLRNSIELTLRGVEEEFLE